MEEQLNNEISKQTFPHIRYIQNAKLATSIIHYFLIGLMLFSTSVELNGWITYGKFFKPIGMLIAYGGLILVILGFFDWYQGKGLLSFCDFSFGLFAIVRANLVYINVNKATGDVVQANSKIEGTYLILWLICLGILCAAVPDKSLINLVNFALLALAAFTGFIWEYSSKIWLRKFTGYFLFFGAITHWITGIIISLFENGKPPITSQLM